ncbi:hypothetical protein F5Y06DRAFT_299868 [Hypoxylon sp. FL0890]|nr:hypothetical protein F5Y06DRAFT_299868 [Hypoxylon sp. FL0890]
MRNDATGGGMIKLQFALEDLIEHPERVERARERFNSLTPPSASTQLQQQRRLLDAQYFQLKFDRLASLPSEQFWSQIREETPIVIEGVSNRTHRVQVGLGFEGIARENVKSRWIAQGIWNDKWNSTDYWRWRWKHEEPLQIESQHDATPRTEENSRSKLQRDASRPWSQFDFQVSRAREQIERELELKVREDRASVPFDITTRAYERVKNKWIKDGIWDTNWGVLPGLSWKHERPLHEFLDDDLIAFAKEHSLADRSDLASVPESIAESHSQKSIADTAQKEVRASDAQPENGNGRVDRAFSPEELFQSSSIQPVANRILSLDHSTKRVNHAEVKQSQPNTISTVLEELVIDNSMSPYEDGSREAKANTAESSSQNRAPQILMTTSSSGDDSVSSRVLTTSAI